MPLPKLSVGAAKKVPCGRVFAAARRSARASYCPCVKPWPAAEAANADSRTEGAAAGAAVAAEEPIPATVAGAAAGAASAGGE